MEIFWGNVEDEPSSLGGRKRKRDQSGNLPRGIVWCSQSASRARSQGEGMVWTKCPLFTKKWGQTSLFFQKWPRTSAKLWKVRPHSSRSPSVSRLIAAEQSNVLGLDHAFEFIKQSPTHDLIQFTFAPSFLLSFKSVYWAPAACQVLLDSENSHVQGQQALAS